MQDDISPCPICHEALHDSPMRVLRCGHAFHDSCVRRWFEWGATTCPTCRAPQDNLPRQQIDTYLTEVATLIDKLRAPFHRH